MSSVTGVVKFFNTEKGYGFISPHDGSGDVFVHVSVVSNGQMLATGDTVFYESAYDTRKGKYVAKTCAVTMSGGNAPGPAPVLRAALLNRGGDRG